MIVSDRLIAVLSLSLPNIVFSPVCSFTGKALLPAVIQIDDIGTLALLYGITVMNDIDREKPLLGVLSSPKKASLLANRNFVLLLIGQSFSLIGDWFFSATLTIWIIATLAHGQTWLPMAVGSVPLIVALPTLLLGPFAGVFVDRWNRRTTMLKTDALRMGFVTLFLLLTLLISNTTWLLVSCYGILLACACGSQFFDPARIAVVADIATPEQRPQAFGMLQQANNLAQIVGPSLAVPLYLALGPFWAIAFNAFSFLLSFLVLLALRVPAYTHKGRGQNTQPYWHDFKEGLRFFVGSRVLIVLLVTGMIFMFAGMTYNSFAYLFGVENLHVPESLLGVYVACLGLGVVAGMPLTAFLAKRFGEARILWVFLICHGITSVILSRMTSMAPGMICVLLRGFFSTSIFVTVRPLTLRVTPRDLIGRVMAFEQPLITTASLLGGTLAGILTSTTLAHLHVTLAGIAFGPLDTVFFAIGVLVIGAGLYAMFFLQKALDRLV